MPQKLPPQFYKDFSSGQISGLSENIVPQNSVKLALNMVADHEIGALVSRLGSVRIGNQLVSGKVILGLHNHRDDVGSSNKLFATLNASDDATSVIYDVVAGTTAVTGLTAGLDMSFLTYLNETLAINGTDAVRAYTGSSWITTGGAFDLGNMPSGYKYAIEFLDRVMLAGNASNPDRIQYSGIQSGGAVSWTVSNGFVDLEPEDGGGGITGFGKVPGYVLIFKERSMKRWNFNSTFPESLVQIGTSSPKSIVYGAGICGFFSASSRDAIGFYITNGGRPTPISHQEVKMIKPWIDAIPSSYYDKVSGIATDSHFQWSIGDVTIEGTTYNNVHVRWSIKTGEWVVFSYPTESRIFALYVSGLDSMIVTGDNNGQVIELDKPATYTDQGPTDINWRVEMQQEDWQFNQKKSISERVIVNTRGVTNARVGFIVNGKRDNQVILGDIQNDIQELKISKPIRGNFIELFIEGSQPNGRVTIKEVEIPNIVVLDTY